MILAFQIFRLAKELELIKSNIYSLNSTDLNHSSCGVPKPILSDLFLIGSNRVPFMASRRMNFVIPFLMIKSLSKAKVFSTRRKSRNGTLASIEKYIEFRSSHFSKCSSLYSKWLSKAA